jgi:hypothetical protein
MIMSGKEGDLVLGRGQLLAQLHHVLVGLEVGIGLGQREEAAQGAGEKRFGSHQPLHGLRVTRIVGRGLAGRHRLVARIDHRLQGLPLVLEIALGGLHQIGDQVVTPFELDFDLGKGVLEPVAQLDQPVVDTDRPDDDEENDNN